MPHGVQVPREVKRRFWASVRAGHSAFEAAEDLGVSGTMGNLWLRQAGGMVERVKVPTGRRLCLEERETIALMLVAGFSQRAIAAEIQRDASVVSREIRRNSTSRDGYRATVAQLKSEKRAQRPKVAKLAVDGLLRTCVQDRLKKDWSPEQIANVLRVEHPNDPQMRVCARDDLPVAVRPGPRCAEAGAGRPSAQPASGPQAPSQRRGSRGRLPATISISERPAEVADRAVPGHWEGDLIIGENNGSAIGTLVERTSRFVMLIHLPGRRTAQESTTPWCPPSPRCPTQLRRSLTWDQRQGDGHARPIHRRTDIDIYFADPHSPWQRGSNENTNGLLRQYFPKGISLRQFGPDHLDKVAARLNNRPRKTLEWRTPAQMLNEILSRPFEPVLH